MTIAEEAKIQEQKEASSPEDGSGVVESEPGRTHRLVRQMDLRILPLCAWIYLLNYLDRGNIGNSKVLNKETGDSLLQKAHMSNTGYAVTLTLFSIAYAVFEVGLAHQIMFESGKTAADPRRSRQTGS